VAGATPESDTAIHHVIVEHRWPSQMLIQQRFISLK